MNEQSEQAKPSIQDIAKAHRDMAKGNLAAAGMAYRSFDERSASIIETAIRLLQDIRD